MPDRKRVRYVGKVQYSLGLEGFLASYLGAQGIKDTDRRLHGRAQLVG